MCALVTQSCLTLCHPMTVAHQASLPMGFPRQAYWSGLPFPLPKLGIFPNQGSNPALLHYRQILYHYCHLRSPVERWREQNKINDVCFDNSIIGILVTRKHKCTFKILADVWKMTMKTDCFSLLIVTCTFVSYGSNYCLKTKLQKCHREKVNGRQKSDVLPWFWYPDDLIKW